MVFFLYCSIRDGSVGILLSVVILLSVGILYNIVLKKLTRYIPAFKSMVIACEYAMSIILLYGLAYSSCGSPFTILFGLFVFLKMFNVSVFYDIRDVEGDALNGLMTVPVLLGYRKTLSLLTLLTVAAGLLVLAGVYLFSLPVLTVLLLPFSACYYRSVVTLRSNGGKFYKYDPLVSVEFLLWPLTVIIVPVACAGFSSGLVSLFQLLL